MTMKNILKEENKDVSRLNIHMTYPMKSSRVVKI